MDREFALVCGGRKYKDKSSLFEVLDALYEEKRFNAIVQGGARGADAIAKNWAEVRGVHCKTVEAEWNRFGRSAGRIRNVQMLHEFDPVIVVAAPGGAGTAHMCREARKAHKQIVEVKL